jgi:amidophosphoribosyltransferase
MCKHINAKTLKFLSLNGLYKALGKGERNNSYPQFSDHYFTGDYPIRPTDILDESKVTQLSLLSSKSNS